MKTIKKFKKINPLFFVCSFLFVLIGPPACLLIKFNKLLYLSIFGSSEIAFAIIVVLGFGAYIFCPQVTEEYSKQQDQEWKQIVIEELIKWGFLIKAEQLRLTVAKAEYASAVEELIIWKTLNKMLNSIKIN